MAQVLFPGNDFDFSVAAAREMFEYESRGIGDLGRMVFEGGRSNGYAVGKHWLDWQVAEWLKAIKAGNLLFEDLYQHSPFPRWWLLKVFSSSRPVESEPVKSFVLEDVERVKRGESPLYLKAALYRGKMAMIPTKWALP